MGGAFDISQFLDGYYDQDAYFLNPLHFLPNLTDSAYLDQFRRNKWVLATGEYDICRAANESFSGAAARQGHPAQPARVGSRLETRLAGLAAHGCGLPTVA